MRVLLTIAVRSGTKELRSRRKEFDRRNNSANEIQCHFVDRTALTRLVTLAEITGLIDEKENELPPPFLVRSAFASLTISASCTKRLRH